MRTALFTGAGASKAIGYPLTSEFLPRVRRELKSGPLFDKTSDEGRAQHDRDELGNYLLGLFPGFEKPDQPLPLITDVFSLVEHALVSGEALPIGGENKLRRCRDLLKQAITDILYQDSLEPWDDNNPAHLHERDTHLKFADWVQHQGDELGLVTTNYDIGLEYELYRCMGRDRVSEVLDLGFDWRDPLSNLEHTRPANPDIRVYKLHGSLDQLRCPVCGYVYFNEWGVIAQKAFRGGLDDENTCICQEHTRLELHIVSPSLVREVRDANLLSVWRSALEWMRLADQWIIVGYSLPPEDLGVRSLLIRAYASAPQKKKPKIMVVQKGEAERPRYELLFPVSEYISGGLEEFLARTP